jgi:hypothetical protein
MLSSPVYIDIVPSQPLPEGSAGTGPHVNPTPAYVPLPKFAHHRGQHTRRSKGRPRGGPITALLPAEYVLSKQIDDNSSNNNNDDAHQSEGELDKILAGSALLEGVEGSATLEGVIDGLQEDSVEGDEVDKGPALEGPLEETEASIPLESMMLCRKAAKRTLPWDLKAPELDLVSPLQQADDIRATKMPRLETPIAIETAIATITAASEAAAKSDSPDVAIALSPPADVDDDGVIADSATDAKSNPRAAGVTGRWTREEDAELTSALANTSKKRWGKEYKTDWDAVAALVLSRTNKQCNNRWHNVLDPSIDRSNERTGKWTEDEDNKLKDEVRLHGGKNWAAIAALVLGRTKVQCANRWNECLKYSIDGATGRTGKWTAYEDSKLKDAVQTHGGKNWAAIAALVLGRTKVQCTNRWNDRLKHRIDRVNGRTGKWTADEDNMLKDAVQTHGGKNWAGIAALVPGRTKIQCYHRRKDALDPSIALPAGRSATWTEDEDSKLKDAVQMHGGKNWVEIAALVPGRTNSQCAKRWNDRLKHSIDGVNGRTGKWTADEDNKLKDAVQSHGGGNWVEIAALVPGRTKVQCNQRWHAVLKHSIDRVNGRTGKWTEDEDSKLKDAVQMHGGKNWVEIAALVPGRAENQCRSRWQVLRRSPK